MDERNLTIQDVYNGTGISRNTISQLVNGKSKGIQFETLEKLSNFFNLEVPDFFSEKAGYTKFNLHIRLNNLSDDFAFTKKNNSDIIANLNIFMKAGDKGEYHNIYLPIAYSYDQENNCLYFYSTESTRVLEIKGVQKTAFPQRDSFYERGGKLKKNKQYIEKYYSLPDEAGILIYENEEWKVESVLARATLLLVETFKIKELPLFIGFYLGGKSKDENYLWPTDILLNEQEREKYLNAKYPERVHNKLKVTVV